MSPAPPHTYDHYIDGRGATPTSGEYLPTENPFTGETWAEIARGDVRDVDRAVAAARRAFEGGPWPSMSPSERGRLLWSVGDRIAAGAEQLARTECRDNGKIYSEVIAQVKYMGDYFKYLSLIHI